MMDDSTSGRDVRTSAAAFVYLSTLISMFCEIFACAMYCFRFSLVSYCRVKTGYVCVHLFAITFLMLVMLQIGLQGLVNKMYDLS